MNPLDCAAEHAGKVLSSRTMSRKDWALKAGWDPENTKWVLMNLESLNLQLP